VSTRVHELRTLSDRPLAVGFGLSDAQSLARVRSLGATPVIGSALVQELAEGQSLHVALSPRLVGDA